MTFYSLWVGRPSFSPMFNVAYNWNDRPKKTASHSESVTDLP